MNIEFDTIMSFGKYKGKLVSDLLPNLSVDDKLTTYEYQALEPEIKYFAWVKNKTDHTLSTELYDSICRMFKFRPKTTCDKYYTGKRKASRLEHYNDMGYMNDMSFGDVFGDFGF